MASRRLDISSLLCNDSPPVPHNQSPDKSPPRPSPIVPEPVVLAPHLRNNQQQRAISSFESREHPRDKRDHRDRDNVPLLLPVKRPTPSPPNTQEMSGHSTARRHRRYNDYPEPEMEHPRSFHPQDQQQQHQLQQQQQPPQQRQRLAEPIHYQQPQRSLPAEPPAFHPQSRPSSSRSSHSPLVAYTYPHLPTQTAAVSPSLSPTSPYTVIPSHGRFTPPVVPSQRGPSSPITYYQNPHISPLHQRAPSHSQSTSHPHTIPQAQTRAQSQSQSRHNPTPSSQSHPSPTTSHFPIPSTQPLPSSHPHPHPPSTSPLLPKSAKLPYVGLDALVHAASEERRRLSGSSSGEPEMPRKASPPYDEVVQRSRAVVAEQHRQPHQQQHQHQHHRGSERTALEDSYGQKGSSHSPAEEYKLRSAAFSQPFPPQQHQLQQHPQHYRGQERERERVMPEEVQIQMQTRSPIVEELHYRSGSRPHSHHHLDHQDEQRHHHEQQQQQQQQQQQIQLQLQRQRQHHEHLLQQEHRQHQQRAQERMMAYADESPSGPLQSLPHPPASMSRPLSMESLLHPHLQSHSNLNSRPHSARKSDPGQVRRPISPVHIPTPTHVSPPHLPITLPSPVPESRPSKKRRYSSSLSRSGSGDESAASRPLEEKRTQREQPRQWEWDRERDGGRGRERDHMNVDVGIEGRHSGRVEGSPVVPVPMRRPGSGAGQVRRHQVVESQQIKRERIGVGGGGMIRGDEGMSRDRGDGVGQVKSEVVESEVARPIIQLTRTPPGSLAGKLKATRKPEVGDTSPGTEKWDHKPVMMERGHEDGSDTAKTRDQTKKSHSRTSGEMHAESTTGPSWGKQFEKETDPPLRSQPQLRSPPPPSPPPPPPPPPPKGRQEDPHEWLLEHYTGSPSSSHTLPPPNIASPPKTIAISPAPVSPKPASLAPGSPVAKKLPTPTPEAAVAALEQELEEITVPSVGEAGVGKTEPKSETAMDIDVDLAVTELVVETLESGDGDRGHNEESNVLGMEVDVEDELLSLVDDRAPLSPAHPHLQPSQRVSSSSTPAPSSQHPLKPPPLRVISESDSRHPSPPALSTISAPSPPSFLSPSVRQSSSSRPTPDRGSMPPPVLTNVGSAANSTAKVKVKDEAGKKAEQVEAVATAALGKKKPGPKPKVTGPAKPRGKPGPKSKPKNQEGTAPPASGKVVKAPTAPPAPRKSASAAASRSRSTSVMPGGSVGPEGEGKAEKEEEEGDDLGIQDDKLYCVCKTKYDEDRVMIACDRCDEWYHTACVNMPDLEVDLVDQFICPPCIEKNPQLFLQTTYKRRCHFGLEHADPSSSNACHKPARGAFSKYCSDSCGVKYMQARIDAWAKKGGKKEALWESVKSAEKREGVVVRAEENGVAKIEADDGVECKREDETGAKKGKFQREVERLDALLDRVVKLREEIKKGMEVVAWRERLLELASERAENVGLCGWDQRLCFGDEEWADFGAGVLESYEENHATSPDGTKEDEMQVDSTPEGDGEWWCPGTKKCERHAGWQAIRYRDVCKEKEKKEEALLKLTTREREIRKRIEDMVTPHSSNCPDNLPKSPLKSSNTKLSNGHVKVKPNGEVAKKGKKRKALGP